MVDEFFGGVVVFIVLNFIYWFDGIMQIYIIWMNR